jgi:hypothetical protein
MPEGTLYMARLKLGELLQRWLRLGRQDSNLHGAEPVPFAATKISLSNFKEEVLGRYRARYKDDFILCTMEFSIYKELSDFVGRLSFVHGSSSIEKVTTDPGIILMVIRYTDHEFGLIIGGQLDRPICKELISKCRKYGVNHTISSSKENCWYANELRQAIIELDAS